MPQQKMINRVDIVNVPQWADEGNNRTNPSNYGKKLAGAGTTVWVAPLHEGDYMCALDNEYVDIMFAGSLRRQGKVKIRETNGLTVKGNLVPLPQSYELFEWGFNSEVVNNNNDLYGPAKSRTWLQSYNDANATSRKIYQFARGCKPENCTFTISKTELAKIELQMVVKDYFEGIESETVGDSSVIAAAPTNLKTKESSADPLKFADIGEFVYNPNMVQTSGNRKVKGTLLPFRSISITCAWGLRRQDSNGSDKDLFVDYASQKISGSIDAFKLSSDINEDARTDNLYCAYLELEKPSPTKKDSWASKDITVSSAKKLTIYSKLPGVIGHEISVTQKAPSGSTSTVEVSGKDIIISPKTGATFAEIKTLINSNKFASRYVVCEHTSGDGGVVAAASAKASLAGGVDKLRKILMERFIFSPSGESLIEQSDATIESKSFEADVGYARMTVT